MVISVDVCCSMVFGTLVGVFVLCGPSCHLKFGVVCIGGRRYVCCSECNVVSNECNKPTSYFVQHIGTHGRRLCTLGVFALWVSLVF